MTSVENFIIWNDVEVKLTLETSGDSNVKTPTVNGSVVVRVQGQITANTYPS